MKTLDDLTEAESAEAEQLLAELSGRGYRSEDSIGKLTTGVRIRHRGQQYLEAYENGTGVIVAVTRRMERDVEVVVAYDEPRFRGMSRLTVLANYHVDVITH